MNKSQTQVARVSELLRVVCTLVGTPCLRGEKRKQFVTVKSIALRRLSNKDVLQI